MKYRKDKSELINTVVNLQMNILRGIFNLNCSLEAYISDTQDLRVKRKPCNISTYHKFFEPRWDHSFR